MLRKTILAVLLLISFVTFSYGQTNDSLICYVKKLNWESFGIIPNYATTTYKFDESASKIIDLLSNDKRKSIKLLKFINQPEKTVAIHAILTKVYFPDRLSIGTKSIFKVNGDGKNSNDEIIANEFSLNGLLWLLDFKDPPKYSISSLEILKVKKFWSKINLLPLKIGK